MIRTGLYAQVVGERMTGEELIDAAETLIDAQLAGGRPGPSSRTSKQGHD